MPDQQAILEDFQRDIDYYRAHYEELLGRYPDKWVAIFGQTVVGAGPELEPLLNNLQAKGIPPERVVVKHPSSEQGVWILVL